MSKLDKLQVKYETLVKEYQCHRSKVLARRIVKVYTALCVHSKAENTDRFLIKL